jgi:hypothetical protein
LPASVGKIVGGRTSLAARNFETSKKRGGKKSRLFYEDYFDLTNEAQNGLG